MIMEIEIMYDCIMQGGTAAMKVGREGALVRK